MSDSTPISQEIKSRGSFLFPFELYNTDDRDGSFYVSPTGIRSWRSSACKTAPCVW